MIRSGSIPHRNKNIYLKIFYRKCLAMNTSIFQSHAKTLILFLFVIVIFNVILFIFILAYFIYLLKHELYFTSLFRIFYIILFIITPYIYIYKWGFKQFTHMKSKLDFFFLIYSKEYLIFRTS